jgi:hypothetical protein
MIDLDKISQKSVKSSIISSDDQEMEVEEDINKLKQANYSSNLFSSKKSKPPKDSIEFPHNLSSKIQEYGREIIFKNYIPNDQNFIVERVKYYEEIERIESGIEQRIRKAVKDFISLEKNPLNIVPKKNNIDLKKNLSKKLEKLNRRTEIAILEIISKFIFLKLIFLKRTVYISKMKQKQAKI